MRGQSWLGKAAHKVAKVTAHKVAKDNLILEMKIFKFVVFLNSDSEQEVRTKEE